MTKKYLACLGTLLLPLLSAPAAEEGWVDLFNGRDQTGWVQHGGAARYTVEDGVLVGRTVLNTGNSFLCTEKDYDHFILELEFKVHPALNSGVQIRSQWTPPAEGGGRKDQAVKGAGGRVFGYQCEIDMDDVRGRWWTAGLYDEARRGWLHPGKLGGDEKAFTIQGKEVSKPGEWNRLRIEANGDLIKTWLNGAPRAEIRDRLTPRGFIGLQVHGVGGDKKKEGMEIRFRNIRLQPLAAGDAGLAVLVYTKNGKGFVHDNIAACAEVIRQLGQAHGFSVNVSSNAAVFADDSLKKYRALIFDNTNNEIFDTEGQKAAFQRFIRAGGGCVGIHSACGSERDWPWFGQLIGGTFKVHPKFQPFTIKVLDRQHPSTTAYPAETFTWADEFYFLEKMPADLHILLAGDLAKLDFPDKTKYRTEKYGDWHPLAWCHEFDGGRAWYTALGHKQEAYSDPIFQQHLLGGIQWAMGEKK